MTEQKKSLTKAPLVEEVALAKINQYINLGMKLPEGFNPTNSLKKARMMLNDMKVNNQPVLQACTPQSIIQCLIDSCCKGLDFSESQIYFIPRSGKMTTMESVYGRITRAKRASQYYKPIVQYVHEGDDFEIGVDTTNGKTIIKKHDTSLENLDKPIIAAYTYVTDNNGDTNIFIMTKKDWIKSWSKSPNGCAVGKEFEKDMIFRTIIKKSTKALVNADVKYIYSQEAEDDDTPLAGDRNVIEEENENKPKPVVNFEEADVVEDVNEETGEVVNEESAPKEEEKKEEEDLF